MVDIKSNKIDKNVKIFEHIPLPTLSAKVTSFRDNQSATDWLQKLSQSVASRLSSEEVTLVLNVGRGPTGF
jgi:hypothetical protein